MLLTPMTDWKPLISTDNRGPRAGSYENPEPVKQVGSRESKRASAVPVRGMLIFLAPVLASTLCDRHHRPGSLDTCA